MTQRVSLAYPATVAFDLAAITEEVDVKPTDEDDCFELTAHPYLMALGPGDVVRVDRSMRVTEVVHLEPQYIYHVDLHLPADFFAGPMPDDHPAMRTMTRLFGEWERDTWVTVMTDFVCVVSSRSGRWIEDKVRSSKYVEAMHLTRTPETTSVPMEAKPVM